MFLVNTTDETFLQWKPGTPDAVAALYYDLFQLYNVRYVSSISAAELGQMTVADVLALPDDRNDPELTQYKHTLMEALDRMPDVGMKRFDGSARLLEAVGTALRGIAAEHIWTRTISGISTGGGILSASFSCEETGDYQTKVLFGLGANSQKLGEKEHKSILGYLYNMDTDGVNTRKFIFPFITTKDAPGFHEWSFLGGLFEHSVEDGKTGGRIFFFPYGNRPEKD